MSVSAFSKCFFFFLERDDQSFIFNLILQHYTMLLDMNEL